MNSPGRQREVVLSFLLATFAMILYATGLNLFIQPMNFYSGGFMGIAQLIRSFLVFLHIPQPNFDLSGILFYILNIPMLILAYRNLGRGFFIRTIIMTSFLSIFTTLMPIPSDPLIHDPLTGAIVGGVLCGLGTGLNLYAGYSAAGMDILGLYMIKKNPAFSVGRISIMMNIAIFGILAFAYDFETVVYSFIYNAVLSLAIDKVHAQNINVWVMIFTKREEVDKAILGMGRGVTEWEGTGAYTGDRTHVLTTMVSKVEIRNVKRLVLEKDPKAFIITTEGSQVTGGFLKRL